MDRARRTHTNNKARTSLYIRELYEQLWGQIGSDRVSHTVCTQFVFVKLKF